LEGEIPDGQDVSTPVTRALSSLGVPYRLFRHRQPPGSLAQAAHERGQRPEQIVRSLVFRLGAGEYLMVLAAGDRQVSWPVLRRHLGRSRLTLASEEEVLSVTGYPLGAVSPFGLPNPIRILIDRSVITEEEVSIGSGERGLAVILRSEDLFKALGEVEIVDLAVEVKS
jgi:Cys-tRNA(Pro) deacylase